MKWVRALSLNLVAPVRTPVVCQSVVGVAHIQLTISMNCETGIGLAYSLRFCSRLQNIALLKYSPGLFQYTRCVHLKDKSAYVN